jgi:hypothetical protein
MKAVFVDVSLALYPAPVIKADIVAPRALQLVTLGLINRL